MSGGPSRRSTPGGVRPFRPGEAPPGVRPGLAARRRGAGVVPGRTGATAGPGAPRVARGSRGDSWRRRLRTALLLATVALGLTGPVVLAEAPLLLVGRVQVDGTVLLDPAAVEGLAQIQVGERLLGADLRAAERTLAATPFVVRATVRAELPDLVRIEIEESPLLMRWSTVADTWLVDGGGRVVGSARDPHLAASAAAGFAALPELRDTWRSEPLAPGVLLPSLDIDVATRLASLVPADIGSAATDLTLRHVRDYGFVLDARGPDLEWHAVFGRYSATLRPPGLVPEQVRLLRSLLAGREAGIGWVILADGRAGTYTPRGEGPPSLDGLVPPGPGASGSPGAGPSGTPDPSPAASP